MAVGQVGSIVNRVLGREELPFRKLPSVYDQAPFITPAEYKRRKKHIASSWVFVTLIVVMTVLNSCMLGVELDNSMGDRLEDRLVFFLVDLIFAAFFFAEMLLRLNQQGWEYFLDTWNFFDFALVVLNCVDLVVAVTSDAGGPKIATTLRVARLLRVSDHIRGVRMFYGMWLVIQGMVDSLKTMVWAGVFLCVMVYSFGVALSTLVGQDEVVMERWNDADEYTGSVFRSCITVIQVFTFDSWTSQVVRPLIAIGHPAGAAILTVAIVTCNFGVLNIVIALMVERLTFLKKEQDMKNGKFLMKVEEDVMRQLGDDFRAADLDNSGELDYEEFRCLIREKHIAFKLRLLGICTDEAESFFELMDADKSGSLTPQEFVEGLQRVRGQARSQDLVAFISFAQKHAMKSKRNIERTRTLITQVDEIQRRMDMCGKSLSIEFRDRQASKVRNDEVWKGAKERVKIIGKMDKERACSFPSLKGMSDFTEQYWE